MNWLPAVAGALQPREWLGFGGSFTEAAAETFRRMSAPKRLSPAIATIVSVVFRAASCIPGSRRSSMHTLILEAAWVTPWVVFPSGLATSASGTGLVEIFPSPYKAGSRHTLRRAVTSSVLLLVFRSVRSRFQSHALRSRHPAHDQSCDAAGAHVAPREPLEPPSVDEEQWQV